MRALVHLGFDDIWLIVTNNTASKNMKLKICLLFVAAISSLCIAANAQSLSDAANKALMDP